MRVSQKSFDQFLVPVLSLPNSTPSNEKQLVGIPASNLFRRFTVVGDGQSFMGNRQPGQVCNVFAQRQFSIERFAIERFVLGILVDQLLSQCAECFLVFCNRLTTTSPVDYLSISRTEKVFVDGSAGVGFTGAALGCFAEEPADGLARFVVFATTARGWTGEA
jgi:hypothetical protein